MRKLVLLVNVFAFLFNAQSQNVAINATGALPHASAGLDVSYPNKGVLIPRVNLTSINDVVTIPGAANSLLVYNTNATITGGCGVGYYYWNGTQWVCFLTSPGSGGGSSMAWLTNGNVGTNPATNFLGTIDNQDLVIRTNNVERVRVKTSGELLIGTSTPIMANTQVQVKGPITGIGIYAQVQSGAGVSGETNASGPGNNGVEGYQRSASGGQKSAGVLGYSDGSSGNGMYAECSRGTAFPLGIWGVSERGNPNSSGFTNTNGYAGYFGLASSPNPAGHVRVLNDISIVGNMSAGSKSFKIDHPLDPENKYLYHSCVESPDMMNIYNGIVTTDANGEAVVKLPEYFQALNKDYRYQLTPIGQFAQCIVFKEIENNQFVIKTDKPNVKVSWQVTGVRNDPYAQKYRIIPEVEKPAEFKGTYLHPELYGKDRTKFEDYVFMKDKERPMPYRLAKERNKEK